MAEAITDTARVASAMRALAGEQPEAALRVQLHALAALVEQIGVDATRAPADHSEEEAELAEVMAAGDERTAIALARGLAAAGRAEVVRVDWSAASGG